MAWGVMNGGLNVYMVIDRRKLGKIAAQNRLSAGWTQNEIALDIGCDVRTVSQFECGYTTSWRVFTWYVLNDILTVDDLKGCARHG